MQHLTSSSADSSGDRDKILAVWRRRGEAQRSLLQALTADSQTDRARTLNTIRDSLIAFSERQMEFFLTGFEQAETEPETIQLDVSDQLPFNYVFSTIVQQVGYDTAVLLSALEGRRKRDDNRLLRAALLRADLVAQEALDPAYTHGLIGAPVVLTYFQKSASIRVVPYVPVTLVGVPTSAVAVRRDLLATPHEVGHYVFNHGRFKNQSIVEFTRLLMAPYPDWLKRWLEEIFADVYGAIVAGPVMAIDFQDLLNTHDQERFLTDDGDHPIEAARPTIYLALLEQLGYESPLIEALQDRWQEIRTERGVPTAFRPLGADENVSYEWLEKALRDIVKMMLDTVFFDLVENHNLDRFGYKTSKNSVYQSDFEVLYTDFGDFAEGLQNEIYPDASQTVQQGKPALTRKRLRELRKNGSSPDKTAVEVVREGVDTDGQVETVAVENKRPIGTTGTWLDDVTNPGAVAREVFMSTAVRRQVLLANGWATQGPNEKWP